jgi:hypothetical protein
MAKKMRQNWWLGFLGFLGFQGLNALINQDWWMSVWIFWFVWFIYFIPVKKK